MLLNSHYIVGDGKLRSVYHGPQVEWPPIVDVDIRIKGVSHKLAHYITLMLQTVTTLSVT